MYRRALIASTLLVAIERNVDCYGTGDKTKNCLMQHFETLVLTQGKLKEQGTGL
jgi:hypothetical protein